MQVIVEDAAMSVYSHYWCCWNPEHACMLVTAAWCQLCSVAASVAGLASRVTTTTTTGGLRAEEKRGEREGLRQQNGGDGYGGRPSVRSPRTGRTSQWRATTVRVSFERRGECSLSIVWYIHCLRRLFRWSVHSTDTDWNRAWIIRRRRSCRVTRCSTERRNAGLRIPIEFCSESILETFPHMGR